MYEFAWRPPELAMFGACHALEIGFVFDTLDVCTRLGRFLLQELFGARGRAAAALAISNIPFHHLLAGLRGEPLPHCVNPGVRQSG